MNVETTLNNLIGSEFTDGIREYEVIEYIANFKMYRLKNFTENKENELMKLEQIENYLKDKEHYNNRLEKNKQYSIKRDQEAAAEKRQEKEDQEKLNNSYGYLENSNKHILQKTKILNTLNTSLYSEEQRKIYAAKDYYYKAVQENDNCYLKEFFNTSRYSKKKIGGERKKLVDKLEYRFYYNNCFIEVNKMQFEFIKYLIENKEII